MGAEWPKVTPTILRLGQSTALLGLMTGRVSLRTTLGTTLGLLSIWEPKPLALTKCIFGMFKSNQLLIAEQALLTSTIPALLRRQHLPQAKLSLPMILEVVDGLSSAPEIVLHRELKLAIPVKFLTSRELRVLSISDFTSPLTMAASALVLARLRSQDRPSQSKSFTKAPLAKRRW